MCSTKATFIIRLTFENASPDSCDGFTIPLPAAGLLIYYSFTYIICGMIQIFGIAKSFDTKKAERWFTDRRIPFQPVDLKEKGISRGELDSIVACLSVTFGGKTAVVESLIDTKNRDYASIAYLDNDDKIEKLLENPLLLRMPLVRNGRTAATVGYQPDVWENWI
jgi:arsenate reductase (glutaredoxin)